MRSIETSVAMNDNDQWLIEIRSSQMVSLNVSSVRLVLSDISVLNEYSGRETAHGTMDGI